MQGRGRGRGKGSGSRVWCSSDLCSRSTPRNACSAGPSCVLSRPKHRLVTLRCQCCCCVCCCCCHSSCCCRANCRCCWSLCCSCSCCHLLLHLLLPPAATLSYSVILSHPSSLSFSPIPSHAVSFCLTLSFIPSHTLSYFLILSQNLAHTLSLFLSLDIKIDKPRQRTRRNSSVCATPDKNKLVPSQSRRRCGKVHCTCLTAVPEHLMGTPTLLLLFQFFG